ncbi:MAG TPA: glycosyltransferase family 9 protein [Solirubrobacteraceae bacterium]|jgi:ADP-heptose:LPS heptosyltransferase|nr:glycosyltransferase family 9 protein [Solirubrobacteraceae bacterium]
MTGAPNVLIARCDSAGDVLLTGPAVRAVAAAGASVTLLCGPSGVEAARMLPGAERVICFPTPWIDADAPPVDRAALSLLEERLTALAFDQAVVVTSAHQSPLPLALVLRLAGIDTIAAISHDYPGSLLDVRHRVDGDVHEVERGLSLVGALGYRLRADDGGELRVKGRSRRPPGLGDLGSYVAVHPGSSVSARAWPAERHRSLVAALAARGRRVVVTGGVGERELTAFVAGSPSPAVLDVGGCTSLGGLARVLAMADVLVVANTGPAHLAAAVGTPVVSLFAPTVPVARWRPWQVPCELLFHDVPCAGCRARECPVLGHPCLRGVGVEEVLAAVERLAPGATTAAEARAA